MEKLLLVDGHNLLFKAFFGIPERLLPDGRPVQGAIGFIGILKRIIKQVQPTHLMVIFDSEGRPSRTLRFADYKANRRDFSGVSVRKNPFTQLVFIAKILCMTGIKHVEATDSEADDLIASYGWR